MFTEKVLVEDYIVKKLQEEGWKFVPNDDLERESFEEPLLIPNLLRAIRRINKIEGLTQDDINRALNELRLCPAGIEGAKKILRYFKFGIPVKLEKRGIVEKINLFDYEILENNEFIVTRQVNYNGRERIRTDIMLYINGIPIVNIECKNPASISESWVNAYRQIKNYENIIPELYKYVQIGVAAEAIAKYFPIVPWQDRVKVEEWKMEEKERRGDEKEWNASYSILHTFLSRDRLLDILLNFLFFRIEMGNATKVIARYMQYRAANKIFERVVRNLESQVDRNKGLIWHWQGSGKTLTMIFAAIKLFYSKFLKNPTIFFILDRITLKDQLKDEFNALDTIKPEIINTKDELKEVIESNDYRGKSGIFITLIHKFTPEDFKDIQKELEISSENAETIMNRKNIIGFIDEAHRTQYGLLATQMKSILKNGFFFAFTGTPISKIGRDTYLEFSYPPDEIYLDRYFITDSIRDGFTVKIVYQPRLEKFHLEKPLLEAFLESTLEEIPENEREIVEEKIKKKVNPIKVFLEDEERINAIAEDIANHFKENFDDRFKAMVVAASRKACAKYIRALHKFLPREYTEVIMTHTREDKVEITGAIKETRKSHDWKDYETIKKEVKEKFKEEEFPKILIVTDMLLTGFDAPILQVMYLDKPLKEHRLLQAVARTNRPFHDLKEAGIIIDYVGVLKEFKRALEMYNETDIKGALFNLESIRDEFKTIIERLSHIFSGVPQNYERETFLKTVEILTEDPKIEKDFIQDYKRVRKIFEILGPDEVKLDYFKEYKFLTAIYNFYYRLVLRKQENTEIVSKYYRKTLEYIHKTTEIEGIEKEFPLLEVNEEYLEKLEQRVKNKREKAANILFALNKLVLVEKYNNPIYESLVEKVERLMDMWREKVKNYGEIYKEAVEILNERNYLTLRQRNLGLNNMEYGMLLNVEKTTGEKDKFVEEIEELSKNLRKYMFPGWFYQITVRKEAERELRRFVRRIKKEYNLTMKEMDNLFKKLVENVKYYGS